MHPPLPDPYKWPQPHSHTPQSPESPESSTHTCPHPRLPRPDPTIQTHLDTLFCPYSFHILLKIPPKPPPPPSTPADALIIPSDTPGRPRTCSGHALFPPFQAAILLTKASHPYFQPSINLYAPLNSQISLFFSVLLAANSLHQSLITTKAPQNHPSDPIGFRTLGNN